MVLRATRKSMLQFKDKYFLETLDFCQIFEPNLKKQKCYFIKRIDWEHTLEEKNILCHGTFNKCDN